MFWENLAQFEDIGLVSQHLTWNQIFNHFELNWSISMSQSCFWADSCYYVQLLNCVSRTSNSDTWNSLELLPVFQATPPSNVASMSSLLLESVNLESNGQLSQRQCFKRVAEVPERSFDKQRDSAHQERNGRKKDLRSLEWVSDGGECTESNFWSYWIFINQRFNLIGQVHMTPVPIMPGSAMCVFLPDLLASCVWRFCQLSSRFLRWSRCLRCRSHVDSQNVKCWATWDWGHSTRCCQPSWVTWVSWRISVQIQFQRQHLQMSYVHAIHWI